MTDKQTDGLGALADALAIKRAGWHRQENPDLAAVAYFPIAAKDVEAWEARALAQARESERMERETRPAPKEGENAYTERLRRGD